MEAASPRAARDRLAAAAFAVFAAAATIEAVGALLRLAGELAPDDPRGAVVVAAALGAVAPFALVGAFVVARSALLAAPARRAARLAAAVAIAAVGFLAELAGAVTQALADAADDFPARVVAADATAAAGRGLTLLAAVVAATAFALAARRGARARDRRLAWGAAAAALALVLDAATGVLWGSFLADVGAPGGVVASQWTVASGALVSVGAAALAAVAFARSDVPSAGHRDLRLAVAAGVLALGTLVAAAGALLYAASGETAGVSRALLASDWVYVAATLAYAVAVAVLAAAFRAPATAREERVG